MSLILLLLLISFVNINECRYTKGGGKLSRVNSQKSFNDGRNLLEYSDIESNIESIGINISEWEYYPTEWYYYNFTCFNDDDLTKIYDKIMELQNINNDDLNILKTIGNGVEIILDDYGLTSLASFIILREILNYTADVVTFYDEAFDVVNLFEPPHVHMEIYPSDFDDETLNEYTLTQNTVFVTLSGVSSDSQWAILKDIGIELESELNNKSGQTFYLDWWRSYTNDFVIDIMDHQNYSVGPNPDVDDWGYIYACEDEESINCTESSWFGNACNDYNCTTLINWFPNYNDYEEIDIINDFNMRLKIEYLGGEWTGHAQGYLEELINNKSKVLFSLWEPTVWSASDIFTVVSYPTNYSLHESERVFKLIPFKLKEISLYSFSFLSNVIMDNDIYKDILNMVWNEVGVYEATEHRAEATCQWLRNNINTTTWISWLPNIDQYKYICESYSDASLERLVNIDFNSNNNSYNEWIDMKTASRIRNECVTSVDYQTILQIIAQILSGLGLILVIFYTICIIIFRKKTIIVTSSWRIMLIICFGGLVGLCYVYLYDTQGTYVCYIRGYIGQLCMILLFGGLYGKTYRIERIWTKGMQGQIKRITDMNIVCGILIAYILVVIGFICVTVINNNGYEIHQTIYNRKLYYECKDETLFTYITVVYLFELVFFFSVAILAWRIKNINKQYNEAKHISIILYNLVLFIIVYELVNFSPKLNPYDKHSITSILFAVMIIVNLSVLILPKLLHIKNDTQFISPGITHRKYVGKEAARNPNVLNMKLTIDLKAPTKHDLKTMGDILNKCGYVVAKKDKNGEIFEANLSTTFKSTSPNPNIYKKRNTDTPQAINMTSFRTTNNIMQDDDDIDDDANISFNGYNHSTLTPVPTETTNTNNTVSLPAPPKRTQSKQVTM